MREGSPSRTAIAVAMHRAVHQRIDAPLVFADPLAERIIGARARDVIASEPRRYERAWHGRYLRGALAVRSRVAEEALADAVARGVRQYVVLGAGLDTFGLRNIDPSLRVFEVDHPSTQAWKRKLIAAENLTVPSTLGFVAVDFERERLADRLMASGFDAGKPAFFAWLGVVMYLERGAYEATLRTIGQLAGAGGGVVFDFFRRPARSNWVVRFVLWLRSQHVARLGEPFRGYFEPDEVATDLRRAGFAQIDILDPRTLADRYLQHHRLRLSPVTYIARAWNPLINEP
jgi:methyltransferase (TIGR00027 family)